MTRIEFSGPVVKTVAIIGAGPGGLSAAIALRNQGIQVQVYEQAREFRPVGVGLTLFPNGLRVLDMMKPEIVESLLQSGSKALMVNLKNSAGEMILQTPTTLMEQYGQPMLNIRWTSLQDSLRSFLPADIIHLQHRCIGFSQDDKYVTVQFETGETVQVDLLIGADGLNSVVRQMLIGDGPPHYVGRLSWRTLIQDDHDLLSPNHATFITSAEGKVMSLFDVGGGYTFWSAASLSQTGSLSPSAAAVKSRVLEEFAGWAEPVPEMVIATDATEILERPLFDRPPLTYWSKGRATLLGDAAHPMVPALGQGANTAFEDAYELSQYLSRSSSLESALTSYEKSRIQRTQVIQARSALQSARAYEMDSETYLRRGVKELVNASTNEFENWLYNYQPSVACSN